jgi:hypothetical protein
VFKLNVKLPDAAFKVIVNGEPLVMLLLAPEVPAPATTVHAPPVTDRTPVGAEPIPPARANVTVVCVEAAE